MISIILNSWNPTRAHLHMTMACIAAIRKFTDPEYEIIVVDNTPDLKIRDDYHVLEPYTLIQNTENHTVYESYNQGAAVAKGDKLMFIQSDVFVHERTINKLAAYLDKFDMAFPQQIPLSREDTVTIMNTPDGEETIGGWLDAGLLAITRKAFDKVGGWDGRFRNLLGEKAFYIRCGDLSWTCQTNAFITHIMAGNNLTKDDELYNNEMDFDAQLMRREYDANH
jgi:GT2 family glycosyltransferase